MNNNIKEEVWKDVIGYEGLYEVSNKGNVRSLDRISVNGRRLRGSVKKQHISKGYLMTTLTKNGVAKKKTVGRLVAKAFIPNVENKPEVNHIDENKENNNVDNLQWVTPEENSNHGTRKERIGEFVRANPHLYKQGIKNLRKIHKERQVPIVMIDNKTGLQLKRFDSLKQANEYLGINPRSTGISDVLSGKSKTSRGYKWEYE